jgi:polysaccharide deacetylase family protein (PEP-CTERM system associated)
MNSLLNALTIDVEEHFQVHAFERLVDRRDWDRYPSRVVANTQRILRLLAERGVRATFFVLGWVADRQPELVRQIAAGGHEIATHGYWHEIIYRQTPDQFAADLRQSLDAIGRALNGLHPAGYRAPAFSITKQSLWALDVLRDHGIRYDSSIFPLAAHDRYGIRDAHRFAGRAPQGEVWEFPASTVRWGRQNWPVAGGGYFRLFPLWFTRWAIRHLNAEGHPAVIYLHPWEFDPEQPRMAGASWRSRFRHYVNIAKTEDRLRALLSEFTFAPMCQVFRDYLEDPGEGSQPSHIPLSQAG